MERQLKKESFMKYAVHAARILLGLVFFVFGLNGFFEFIPAPDVEPPPFAKILMESGYIYVVKALEVVGGALLLVNRQVPLGLVLLGPVVVNILLFHLFFDLANAAVSFVVFFLTAFLIWANRPAFAGIFAQR